MNETLPLPPGHEGGLWRYDDPARGHPRHRHEELEFNLVTAGTARYLAASGRHDLQPGTLIWLHPLDDHMLIDRSLDCRMWIGVFRPGLVARMCTQPAERGLRARKPPANVSAQLSPAVTTRLSRLFAEIAAVSANTALTNAGLGYALLLTSAAFAAGDPLCLDVELHPAVRKAAQLIRQAPATAALDAVARKAGLSLSRLSRLFHDQLGTTLVAYRARQRLERFIHLYEQGNITMLAAALDSGFGSYPQFHRVFRKEFKRSPQSLRPRASAGDTKPARKLTLRR